MAITLATGLHAQWRADRGSVNGSGAVPVVDGLKLRSKDNQRAATNDEPDSQAILIACVRGGDE
jgi:hypothetical protein